MWSVRNIISAIAIFMVLAAVIAGCSIYTQFLKVLSASDVAWAHAELAGYHFTGECLKRDPVKGRSLAARAAEQDEPDGLFWLALYNHRGIGGPQNITLAMKQWQDMAERRDWRGAAKLCDAFATGSGVPRDASRAYFWYLAAVAVHESNQPFFVHCDPEKLRKSLADQVAADLQAQSKVWQSKLKP